MNHVLPPQYNEALKSLFMNAPVQSFEEVVKIFKEEFKCHPDDMYLNFERAPVASASIAQVHRANLPDGTAVAVKVQKHYVRKQMFWDLTVYKFLLFAFEVTFGLPMYWSAEYTEKHLREEVDFIKEAQNTYHFIYCSEKALSQFKEHPKISETVHVPKIFWKQTTSRILTSEWVDGIPLTNIDRLKEKGFALDEIMQKIIDIFSFQIFVSGFVHADPHPGNILIRRHPKYNNAQICVLDHGLYMEDVNMFASASLQRPYNPNKLVHLNSGHISMNQVYNMQMNAKERIKQFLSDTERIPRELIFVGRNLNLVRSNNKSLGSPVNRVNIMATWAVRGLGSDWTFWDKNYIQQKSSWSLTEILRPRLNYWRFRLHLLYLTISFYTTRTIQIIGQYITGSRWSGFEDLMDAQMLQTIKTNFGYELDANSFSA